MRTSMKTLACLAFLCNVVLFGTYYAVTKEALTRIDPLIFTYLEMMTLVPVALGILLLTWRDMSRAVIKRGMMLGSSLCLALFTIAIALKYTSATGTAFFPALNGFLAALLAWTLLKHPIGKITWLAGIFSLGGAVLLILNSPMGGVRGALIAFLGGLFFTGYVFLSDTQPEQELSPWPVFAVELLTTAAWANLVVLLFGDWQAVHMALPKDVFIILYVATACTFLPTLVAILMQKYISPVTVSFIYILEPVIGAAFATLYLHETLPLNGYLGGSLVVVGAFVQTWGSLRTLRHPHYSSPQTSVVAVRAGMASSTLAILPSLAGILGSGVGMLLLGWFGGFPPDVWRVLYNQAPSLFASLQTGHAISALSLASWMISGHNMSLTMLLLQSVGWLVAWIALLSIAYTSVTRLFACMSAIHLTRQTAFSVDALEIELLDTQPAISSVSSAHAVNTRALRQMGVTPHTIATARRTSEKPLVQRRRRERQQRLLSIDYEYSYDYDAPLEVVEM